MIGKIEGWTDEGRKPGRQKQQVEGRKEDGGGRLEVRNEGRHKLLQIFARDMLRE